MHPEQATLDTVAAATDELARRVGAAAVRLDGSDDQGIAADLFEVERSLRAAQRRLDKVLRRLSG
ncbi:MAG: hypothetical protein WKF93_06505 [Acidimicrobiales bacterium]|jgi:hypothetical protein